VAGVVQKPVFRRSPYNGPPPASLCPRSLRAAGLVLALALTSGGCSFSYQLGSLFEKSPDEAAADQTSSIAPAEKAMAQASDADLSYARAAASEVLTRGGKESSQPWENPTTGARGTVTPIASAYLQDGFTCQDFLASYVRDGNGEAWLQGEACRIHKGRWEVRSLKPWKSS
jgi:surface antigen